jgi:hypothetical protein
VAIELKVPAQKSICVVTVPPPVAFANEPVPP